MLPYTCRVVGGVSGRQRGGALCRVRAGGAAPRGHNQAEQGAERKGGAPHPPAHDELHPTAMGGPTSLLYRWAVRPWMSASSLWRGQSKDQVLTPSLIHSFVHTLDEPAIRPAPTVPPTRAHGVPEACLQFHPRGAALEVTQLSQGFLCPKHIHLPVAVDQNCSWSELRVKRSSFPYSFS